MRTYISMALLCCVANLTNLRDRFEFILMIIIVIMLWPVTTIIAFVFEKWHQMNLQLGDMCALCFDFLFLRFC